MVKLILKKPYAFLIKNFRIIHALIFIMMLYILIQSVSIYSFFNDYATKHYYTPLANLASNYINVRMFIVSILIIILSGIIYYLLSIKNKNRKTYFFICIYYVMLIAYFLYYRNVFIGLEDKLLSTENVRALRDFGLIAIIPQIVLLFIILLRTLGFNLRQFEFKSDLEDLQIDKSDYEEIEVTLGKNNYKYVRSFRKMIRYLKYFLEENKFFVTIIGSVIVLSLGIIFYVNIKVTNIVYFENQNVYAGTLWFTVENSYITNTNTNGSIIDDDKYYILAKIKIENKSKNRYDLSRELFRLKVNDELLIPIFNLDKEFIDTGIIYKPMYILGDNSEYVTVIFEINKKDVNDEYILKINNAENINISNNSDRYKDIIIKPVDLNSSSETKEYVLPANIDFKDSILKNSNLTINSYIIDYNFKEKIKNCINNSCYNKTVMVEPINRYKAILKLKTNLTVDDNIYMKKYLDNTSSLLEYYGKIKYRYLSNNYESDLVKIVNKKLNNDYTYIEVPENVLEADKIELIISIRGKIYSIILK